MHAPDGQPVLRCPLCQKPFDQASTLKRHGYYCRSRHKDAAPRSRSCVSCAQGKARCDNGRPGCSRCISKGVDCQYPTRSPGRPQSQTDRDHQLHLAQGASRGALPVVATPRGIEATYAAGSFGDAEAPLLTQLAPSENSAHTQLVWDDDFDFNQIFDPRDCDITGAYPFSASSTTGSLPSLWIDHSSALLGQTTCSPEPPVYLAPPEPQRTLTHRPKTGTGAYRIAHVLFQTLKAYPIMMVNQGSLPPIIHPCIIRLNADNEDMEPLNNCTSLLHLLSRGAQGSQKLFWANVRRECESFRATYKDMNKWKLLAVQQALFIYVIVRLDQGETEHNNLDVLMRTTVIEVSERMKAVYKEHRTRPSRFADSWREWIYLESLRRLCSIFQILDLSVDFAAASLCDQQPNIAVAPLPTEKRLWEAPDAIAWQREYEKKASPHVDFALATSGDLIKMGREELHFTTVDSRGLGLRKKVPSRSTANMAEWCSEMDGLGGLVMIAASAIE